MYPRWFALYTYSRHEKVVHDFLRHSSVECFLPLYTTMHKWRNGVKARIELPLFPGYVFVKTLTKDCGRLVRTPSVASVVASAGIPLPLPDREIEVLRERLPALAAEPYPYIHVGDTVRVKRGPLEGLEGLLVHRKGNFRFVLRMPLLMQAASVEVDACDVEPIKSTPYIGL